MIADAARLALPEGLLRPHGHTKLPPRLSISSKILLCEVHDVIAYGHAYIVKGLGTPRMTAVMGTLSGTMTPIGSRSLTMLVPGSLVLCWISESYLPVIISVIATPMGTNVAGLPDSIVACGHAGMFADPAHQQIINRPDCHGLLDFSAGRPIDNLPGDWGQFNEFGMGVFLGRLMTMMRASDACKVEMFYLDQLLRMAAYNYQHYTSGSEREAFNDEGEFTDIAGFTPYPWEAMGAMRPDFEPLTAADADPLQGTNPRFGIEPKNADQLGFWRRRTFRGYLGDLERTIITVPNDKTDLHALGDSSAHIGVMEQIIGLDGSYTLRSAKSITLERTVWIPVPQELESRDSQDGDNNFSNGAGIGTTLQEFPAVGDIGETAIKFYDAHAYFYQKLASQGFNLRKKDWAVPDDPPNTPGGISREMQPLSPYSTFFAPAVSSADQKIDHRRNVKYYEGRAAVRMTDDGGIILEDAYGASIKLVGGNIEISCPGDITFRSGRDVQTWSGRDTIVKSNRDVDVSSAQSDVRIKSERNMMLLGGNSGSGGLLLENRGAGDIVYGSADETNIGGLMLKCSRGNLGILARDLNFKSIGGDISFDSNSGDNDIVMFGNNFNRYLRSGSLEVLASVSPIENTPWQQTSSVEHSTAGYRLSVNNLSIGAPAVSIVNHLSAGGTSSLRMRGSLEIEGGGYATQDFSKTKSDIRSEMTTVLTKQKDDQKAAKQNDLDSDIYTYVRQDGVVGNETVYSNMGFRFRETEELNIADGRIYEAPWQMRFRTTVGGATTGDYAGKTFVEKPVYPRINPKTLKNDGEPTMPYPGYKAWMDGSSISFVRYKSEFYELDSNGGKPKSRGNDVDKVYDVDKINRPDGGKFDKRYPVNI